MFDKCVEVNENEMGIERYTTVTCEAKKLHVMVATTKEERLALQIAVLS